MKLAKILPLFLFFGLLFASPTFATIDDYISHYEFEDNALDTESRENLTANGSPSYVDGYLLRSADLGITNVSKSFSNIATDYGDNISSIGAHTVAGWFKIYEEPTDTSDALFEYWVNYNVGGQDSFFTSVRYYCPSSGNCSFRGYVGRTTLINIEMPYNIDLNEWHHFIFTDNANGNQEFYLDGVDLNMNGTATGASGSYQYRASKFTIGAFYSSGWVDSLLDEYLFYDRALSSTEAVDLYDSYTAPPTLSITNPNTDISITDGTLYKDVLVEGTCPTIGSNQLYVFPDSLCIRADSSLYSVDCQSNNTFFTTTTIPYIFDDYTNSITVQTIGIVTLQDLTNTCVFSDQYGNPTDFGLRQSIDFNVTLDWATTTLSWLIPSPSDTLTVGTTTISGICPINGVNQLSLQADTLSNPPPLSEYNVSCVDNSFSLDWDINLGWFPITVWDLSYVTNSIPEFYSETSYRGVRPSTYFTLDLVFPTRDSIIEDNIYDIDKYYNVEPIENFEIVFSFSTASTSLDYFKLEEYTDSTFTSVSSTITNTIFDTQLDFDSIFNGYTYGGWIFELLGGVNTSIIGEHFYKMTILENGVTDVFSENFVLNSSGIENINLNVDALHNQVDWCTTDEDNIFVKGVKNLICFAVVGDVDYNIRQLKDTTYNAFRYQVPFVYFYMIRDSWYISQKPADTTFTVDFDRFGAFDGTVLDGWTWELFDYEDPNWTDAHLVVFNYLEKYVIPVLFALWTLFLLLGFIKNLVRNN